MRPTNKLVLFITFLKIIVFIFAEERTVPTETETTTAMTQQVHHRDNTSSETCDLLVRYRKLETLVTTAWCSKKNRSHHQGPQLQIPYQVQCQL